MKHERLLLILILSELVLIILSVVVEFAELRAHVSTQVVTRPPENAPLLTILWVLVALGTLLSWIGLLYLFREARVLYVGSWVTYLCLNLLRGPVVDTPVGSVIQMLTALVGGGILGMVYFSELRTRFRPLARHFGARGTSGMQGS